MERRDFLKGMGAAGALSSAPLFPMGKAEGRPNILLCMADDWGWPASPLYGETTLKTPALDRVAKEGVLFNHGYCSSPSCTPSRAALLTGQDFYRLEETSCLHGTLRSKFAVYPDLLEKAGYAVGLRSKGWGPGNYEDGGRVRNPAGPAQEDFKGFLEGLPPDKPFCFWFGSHDPHRPYEKGSGIKAGLDPKAVKVPGFLPDVPEIRSDLCDYFLEIQRFNDDVMGALSALESAGRLENTLIIVTGDNGMPFPRCKTHLYEWGVHQPLAMCWKGKIPGGRVVEDFVSFIDFAPTILEAAGLVVPPEMTGKSLLPLLMSGKSGRIDPARDAVVTGRERHGESFPMRSIRTERYAYIRNENPDLSPAQCDEGPSKQFLLKGKDNPLYSELYRLDFGKREREELYDLDRDPFEMKNLAGDAAYAAVKADLSTRLAKYLEKTGDPRALGRGEVFGRYQLSKKKKNAEAE